jgi:hypothetical protein
VIDTGLSRLERELEHLLAGLAPGTPSPGAQTAAAPVPRQDQPRPGAETAAMTTVPAHPTQPSTPGDGTGPGMCAETAAITTVPAHATQPGPGVTGLGMSLGAGAAGMGAAKGTGRCAGGC